LQANYAFKVEERVYQRNNGFNYKIFASEAVLSVDILKLICIISASSLVCGAVSSVGRAAGF
jgi:hypothetical protein